jgi:hypothetical protein
MPTPHFANPNGDIQWGASGLTIREEFAKAAMVGILASEDIGHGKGFENVSDVAALSVAAADALIAELAKPVQP